MANRYKTYYVLFMIALFFVMLLFPQSGYAAYRIMTYNILSDKYLKCGGYEKLPFHVINWHSRKKRIVERIIESNADIIQLQEVEHDAFLFLCEELKEYGYTGVLGAHPEFKKDSVSTFYKKATFQLISANIYAFPFSSKTFLELTLIDRKSQKKFLAINTKLKWDAPQKTSRAHKGAKQMDYLLEYIKTKNEPILLSGDFNMTPQTPAINKLQDILVDTDQKQQCITILPPDGAKKIDYIFASKEIHTFSSHACVRDAIISAPSLKEPSDHLPLTVDFNFK